MRYYAAENSYGSRESYGFANTWFVVVFDSRAARDRWVTQQGTLTARAITRAEVPRYAANWNLTENRENRPRPFSGEAWVIVPPLDPDAEYMGTIGVGDPNDDYGTIDTFYHR